MKDKGLFRIILALICGICVLFLITPIIALFTFPWGRSLNLILDSFVLKAIIISLKSTFFSLLIIIAVGMPTAYYMARYSFWGKRFVEIIMQLPLVLPPAVAGLLLLVTFGRNGLIGKHLAPFGIQLPFTFIAVVIAQVFIAMPIFIQSARTGFEKVDRELENSAAVLGGSNLQIFYHITMPLSKNSLITGAILSWARALAEFGATMLFAGNLAGKTQTLPLAIYTAMEVDLNISMGISVCLVVVSIGVLVILKCIVRSEEDINV
ncbi:ABC transporter permease [Clostridium tagluense]|uniref:ABC transporter permease n=1 Tax=Clostridium TaxID=1485 RepID=UPI0013E96618|nr:MULTISPECIES: ABC transporter permease [Clostridium]MBU3127483.1 ABC transporter permease [Clostridium tagluense]MBZ9621988.1 ABC transporter permease [Clostridium sp. FP2]MCB2312433.1 ABC transporter permease [Clostridium tagluense]MCB2317108.1 ABC transporter permease [Clostridium tagluense]MCB2321972.1 ABC transporter permease [Clostridium tagluense]